MCVGNSGLSGQGFGNLSQRRSMWRFWCGSAPSRNSVREEFKENEDLPNTSNPDDWAKIAGRKGERIVYVKVLTADTRKDDKPKPVDKIATGQYL